MYRAKFEEINKIVLKYLLNKYEYIPSYGAFE